MTTTVDIKPCLTKEQVAKRLNISLRKLNYMIEEGEIVGFKVGKSWRMKPEHLEKWIEKKQTA